VELRETKIGFNKVGGFTLVEVLIACSIFAISLTVVYMTMRTSIHAYQKTQSELELYQDANNILDKVSLELRNCYSAELDKDSGEGRFLADNHNLYFFTLVNSYSKGVPINVIERINYKFMGGKLFKIIKKDEYAFSEQEPALEDSLINAKDVTFQYLYFVKKTGGDSYEWKDAWLDNKMIPKGVKVKFELIDPEDNSVVHIEREIYVAQGQVGFIE